MNQINTYPKTASDPHDLDAICEAVRGAVEPARTHAVSLHDRQGDVLWLTESSMGPDEHNAVLAALEAFADPQSPATFGVDLGDARSALLLRAANEHRALVGAVMLIVDTRAIKHDPDGVPTLVNASVLKAVADFAAMQPQQVDVPAAESTAARVSALAERPSNQVPPEIDRLHAALRRSPIALHVQRLIGLHGGAGQRYEVLLRSKADNAPNAAPQVMLKAAVKNGLGSMIDRRVVAELIGWLIRHPGAWGGRDIVFSVNLTSTALHDEHFIKFVELCLAKSSLPRALLGFEVDAPTAIKLTGGCMPLAQALQRLGCPLVLDDFSEGEDYAALLGLPGLRCIKIAAELTGALRRGGATGAALARIATRARDYGIEVVAKRTETADEHESLRALGVDFIQSHAFSAPAAIDSLAAAQN